MDPWPPKGVTEFTKEKLEREARRNWDLFYKRNGNRFFKDRHWTTREFPELASGELKEGSILLEVGCGAGNFVFPLLQDSPHLFVYGCDFSSKAIQLCHENPALDSNRSAFFVADLTADQFRQSFLTVAESKGHQHPDIISLIFVLSAISPELYKTCVTNLFTTLKPGGMVLFRDYAIGDHAMTRFDEGSKIDDRFFVRQDGTRVFYFDQESVTELFQNVGFEAVKVEYIKKTTVNRKENIRLERTFLQGTFKKPVSCQE